MYKVTVSKLNEVKVFEFSDEDKMNSALNAMPEAGYTVIAISEIISE